MDQLLLPYLQASNESERQQHLDELLLVHAAPIVRQALRQRLGFYVDQRGLNPHNQDAQDPLSGDHVQDCASVYLVPRERNDPVQVQGVVLERENSFGLFHCLRNLLGGWAGECVFLACVVGRRRFADCLCQGFFFEPAALCWERISQ